MGVMVITLTITFNCFYEHAVILTSAVFGAFALIRGVGIFAEGFYPNELLVYQILKSGKHDALPITFWLAISVMALLAAVSIVVQLRHRQLNVDLYSYGNRMMGYRALREQKAYAAAAFAKGNKYESLP